LSPAKLAKTGVTPSPTPFPTVTPTSIIVLDTFQRQNQTEWGLASDKVNTWGADAKTNPVFHIPQFACAFFAKSLVEGIYTVEMCIISTV
jgi:hypothetical protein